MMICCIAQRRKRPLSWFTPVRSGVLLLCVYEHIRMSEWIPQRRCTVKSSSSVKKTRRVPEELVVHEWRPNDNHSAYLSTELERKSAALKRRESKHGLLVHLVVRHPTHEYIWNMHASHASTTCPGQFFVTSTRCPLVANKSSVQTLANLGHQDHSTR